MRSSRYRPLLFGLAVATAATALLPIVVGALVTSHKAGMAFADWPTSDGQGMFAYPWLKSAGDKFIEHGHRLAGILIDRLSIVRLHSHVGRSSRGVGLGGAASVCCWR